MALFVRFFGFLFAVGTTLFLVAIAGVTLAIQYFSRDLPDYTALREYEPPIMTRVHASNGRLLAEYARERRMYIPVQAVPRRVTDAFLSAEDKNFYQHNGIDISGIGRALLTNIQNIGTNRRPQGASTITQQVAKNFLLSSEQTYDRKLREMLLAMRMEQAFTKDRILELYLNEIYLGLGAYGIAAAALTYFDKSVHELTVAEAAYLAALPKAPNNYHPIRRRDDAVARRNWVLSRMLEDGAITQAEHDQARREPLNVVPRSTGTQIEAAEYFAEEVRRELFEKYGEKKLYEGGLSVRTTLDPDIQRHARKALVDALVRYDEVRGWRGPVQNINIGQDWGRDVARVRDLRDVDPWRMAVVLEVNDQTARIGLRPTTGIGDFVSTERQVGIIPLEGVRWARSAEGPERGRQINRVGQVLRRGDVIYVEPMSGDRAGQFRLRQVPEISGAAVVLDPWTGRVLALVGGFSFDQSQFNRATQALRQPGSSFKPFVYAAALDNGYTPSTVIMDAPFELVQQGAETWRPENYSGRFYGPQTLRFGIEVSRNVMTVRLAQDLGMPLVAEYARRFGVYDEMLPVLSMSLGAGETTLLRMTSAYAMFANGGRRIRPTLVDRIQDRYGRTIFRHDQRECRGCTADRWQNQPEPTLVDRREQVLDPLTAYQITSMMEGVVQRGTATSLRSIGKPLAGKTGTTNEEKDAWFVGYSPDLAMGVYIGFDQPRPMGRGMTGGALAVPVFGDFMRVALRDRPPTPFRVPPGIKLIRIDPRSGMRAGAGDGRAILEAFKPGTSPPDSFAVIGFTDADGRPLTVTPEADRAVRTGTGGLY